MKKEKGEIVLATTYEKTVLDVSFETMHQKNVPSLEVKKQHIHNPFKRQGRFGDKTKTE
jgi:hypothetical protein